MNASVIPIIDTSLENDKQWKNKNKHVNMLIFEIYTGKIKFSIHMTS